MHSNSGMIDLYTWATPNGRKVSIALEELELVYRVHPIDIMKDDQFKPEFLRISPNNRIPGIVDRDTSAQGGAVLSASGSNQSTSPLDKQLGSLRNVETSRLFKP